MKKFGVLWLVCGLILAVALSGCASKPAASAGSVDIMDPWARTAAAGDNTAAYMLLKNGAGEADQLVKAEFQGAGMVEVMNTTMQDDKMTMETIPLIDLPAKGEVELKPGGYHVMLMNLKEALNEGDQITVTLTFANGGSVDVTMPVKKNP